MKKLSIQSLYTLWAAMFALTAVLGFAFPTADGAAARLALMLVSVLFFLPPWVILARGGREHRLLVRYLSMASIALTVVLLCLNLMSARWSESVGIALNAALTVVSAPMVCSNFYVLPLFLWGTLLMGTFRKK